MVRTARPVAILGGNRIPFAKRNGPYAAAGNQDMLTATLDGLAARFGLAGERVGEVAAGAVVKHSRDYNLTREAVLGSQLSPWTPAYDVQQACGTGLEATVLVANKIALGQVDSAIAGGVDSASDAPIAVNEGLRRALLQLSRARTPAQRLRAAAGLRPGHVVPELPRNGEPRTGLSMGDHAAITAEAWEIGRQAQDELAAASHRNLAAAYERGFFDDLMTPYLGLTRDQNLRPDSSVEALARLKPVFGEGPDATMTAGNSTPLSDGASAVLLSSEEWAADHGLPVLAHLVDAETAAVDYVHGGEGLLMAPAYAVPTQPLPTDPSNTSQRPNPTIRASRVTTATAAAAPAMPRRARVVVTAALNGARDRWAVRVRHRWRARWRERRVAGPAGPARAGRVSTRSPG